MMRDFVQPQLFVMLFVETSLEIAARQDANVLVLRPVESMIEKAPSVALLPLWGMNAAV